MRTSVRPSSAIKTAPKSKLRAAILHSNESQPTRFLAIDEEGYFLLDGLRVSDVVTGHEWLSRIRMDDRGRPYLKEDPAARILIEAFDQPLVAIDVEVRTHPSVAAPSLLARFPYGFETEIKADSLRVDEWDRFYARTVDGVPVVFNRAAQSRLFEAATDYDDDSVSFGSFTFPTRPLYEELDLASQAEWWNHLYDSGETRWDSGGPHPRLDSLIPPLKLTRLRVLVLGCGAGHDAAWWEQRGHIVTGIDFSSDAIVQARARYGERETLRWVQADAFNLPASWSSQFDVIFEHTMFCAIPPSRREDLVRTWWRLLSRRGRIIGLVPVMDKLFGPPYGISEWEMRRRLLDAPTVAKRGRAFARFLPLLWNREKNSIEKRLGQELFFVVERADSLTE